MMNFYGYYPMMFGGGLFGGFGWLFSILFWVLIIWLIVSLFSHSARHHHEDNEDNQTSNLKIIKKRYAKGEITKKEYEELKKEFNNDEE